jgi:hypothetical protein
MWRRRRSKKKKKKKKKKEEEEKKKVEERKEEEDCVRTLLFHIAPMFFSICSPLVNRLFRFLIKGLWQSCHPCTHQVLPWSLAN